MPWSKLTRWNLAWALVTLIAMAPLGLGVLYFAIPVRTDWTLDEAPLAKLTREELTNDYWQWYNPTPDRELLALGRTEYLTYKTVLSELCPQTWGYHIYFKFRLHDRKVQDQLIAACQAQQPQVWPYMPERADEPLPTWWHPRYKVTVRKTYNEELFFDPAQPDIAYSTRHYEGTPPY
jgi:hypothetical protein